MIRLTVEHKTTESGNFSDSAPEKWEPLRVEWFSIEPLSGREYETAMQIKSAVTHKAESVYFQGATSELRLRTADKSRYFNVESVVNDKEQNRKLLWRLVEVQVPVEASDG